MTTYMFRLSSCHRNTVHSPFMTYYRMGRQSNTMGVNNRARTDYLSRENDFPPIFVGFVFFQSYVFCVVFCRSLYFFIFLLTIALYVLIQITASYYLFRRSNGRTKRRWNARTNNRRISRTHTWSDSRSTKFAHKQYTIRNEYYYSWNDNLLYGNRSHYMYPKSWKAAVTSCI
jgi:hypothetical protein